jgi:ketosteroid isomerase-like protein
MSVGASNAEKLERLYEAFDQAGFEETARLVQEIFSPEVEFNPLAAGDVGGGTYRGYEGMLSFFGQLNEAFEEVSYEAPQFHPLGEDLVVAFTRLTGRSSQTSLPMRQDLSLVYEFEGGLVRCVTAYETPAEALEAAQRGHADA